MTHVSRLLTLGALCALAATVVTTLTACDDGDAPGIVSTAAVDTTTLVGTWLGTLDGGNAANSLGPANITLVLRADSTFTVAADNPLYCALTGATWTVARGQVVSTGRDCFGALLTMTAPVAARPRPASGSTKSRRRASFSRRRRPRSGEAGPETRRW